MFKLILMYYICVKNGLKENILFKSNTTDGNKNVIFGRYFTSQANLIMLIIYSISNEYVYLSIVFNYNCTLERFYEHCAYTKKY